MSADVVASNWAEGHFGAEAPTVIKRVVTALAIAQQAAWRVQESAVKEGASNARAYGSMWETRYHCLVEQLSDLEGFRTYHPRGAPYKLVLLNGRLLIPFRHSTTLTEPIGTAKLGNEVPMKVSRHFGVQPSPTLFDDYADEIEDAAVPEHVAVIYIAYVANAGSDQLLRAWWGEAASLEEDGHLNWNPEELPVDAADLASPLTLAGASADAPGFDQGAEPGLDMALRPHRVEVPSAEINTTLPTAQDGDE